MRVHNNLKGEYLILEQKVFIGEVEYYTPNIFTTEKYNSWYQQLKDKFSPILFNTKYYNFNVLNQIKGGEGQYVAQLIQKQ